jgi:hypothetical protein
MKKENQTMLSTSNRTRFQYQYLLIAVVILAMASVIALYQSGVLPAISTGQGPSAAAEDLGVYHSGGWGGPVAIQNGLDIYHPSSIQYTSPGR